MTVSRRELLAGTVLAGFAAGAMAEDQAAPAAANTTAEPFKHCLNTSTIRGQELGIVREVEIAAEAGYDAVEPWMRDLDKYVQAGGSLSDLKKRIADLGLTVESAIGFAQWIVDDPEARRLGLEQARRDMDTLVQIGGKRLAAPPVGAHQTAGPALPVIAERYRALLDLGAKIGIMPQVEVWGFSKTLSRLGETVYVAVEATHPLASILPDIYHLYKGGSDFAGLRLLSGLGVQVFHVNDYPADPPRAMINDAARVFPGDGIAPLTAIFRDLRATGFTGYLSLELFNPEYWKRDALAVAKEGLEKTKLAVARAWEA